MRKEVFDLCKVRARWISDLTGLECNILDMDQRRFPSSIPFFCSKCAKFQSSTCDGTQPHLYGAFESARWDGRYIYYCPQRLIFVTACIMDSKNPVATLVCGPIVMYNAPNMEDLDEDLKSLTTQGFSMTTKQVNSLSEVLRAVCEQAATPEKTMDGLQETHDRWNLMYELSQESSAQSTYPINSERQLTALIRGGHKQEAAELINRLMGFTFFASGANLESIRSRAIELIVLLSRSVIECGAEIEQTLWLNETSIKRISELETLDELSRYLGTVAHQYMGYAFDFTNIKHLDIVLKAREYIRNHLDEKITLKELAGYCYISKSYMSQIFRDEIGTSLSDYINQLRIERSKQMLADTNLELSEIALRCGFNDQSYFTRTFKRYVNLSPRRYREQRGT